MSSRFLTRSATMLFLFREIKGQKEILLQKRYNTGYADGMWDCAASGHVEANESMKMTMLREAEEELGIIILMSDISFATLTHIYTPETQDVYYNAFFSASKYEGVPEIKEPDKCSEIRWFNVEELPHDLLPDRKLALQNYLCNIPYSELGWDLL